MSDAITVVETIMQATGDFCSLRIKRSTDTLEVLTTSTFTLSFEIDNTGLYIHYLETSTRLSGYARTVLDSLIELARSVSLPIVAVNVQPDYSSFWEHFSFKPCSGKIGYDVNYILEFEK